MKIPLLAQDQRIRSWAITAAIAAFVSVLCWGAVVLWQPDNNYPQPNDPTARSLQKINSILKIWEQAGYPVGATFSGTTETNINVSALGGMLLNTNPFPVQLRDASGNVASINTSSNMNLGTWGPGATNFDATHGIPVVLANETNNNVVYIGNAVIADAFSNPAFMTNFYEAAIKANLDDLTNHMKLAESYLNQISNLVQPPDSSVVTVVPNVPSSAVVDGQALCYNFTITLPRTNMWLTTIICSDTETNVPASVVLKDFDLYLYTGPVTAQTPAAAFATTPAEQATISSGPWEFRQAMFKTNRVVNTYSGGGVVHVPGVAMTNVLNVLCKPASGTALTGAIKARGSYTPGAGSTNTLSFSFKFLPDK